MTKVAWNLELGSNRQDDISREKWCFLSSMGCYGPDEVPLNSSSVVL